MQLALHSFCFMLGRIQAIMVQSFRDLEVQECANLGLGFELLQIPKDSYGAERMHTTRNAVLGRGSATPPNC
jgi:hypothetical protein